MKIRTRKSTSQIFQILALTCIFGCMANRETPTETNKDGFVPIFDGKTLKGWEARPAETAPAWTVQDGMIVQFKDIRLKILD